jgi:hypothetical protein
MKILGNPVLGKMFNKYALLLNQKGLYRRIRLEGQPDYTIFLTDDPKQICELFDLDFEKLDKLQEVEALEYIKKSDYFVPLVFTYKKTMQSSKDIIQMAEMLTEEDLQKEPLPVDTNRVMEILGDETLLDTINYYKEVLPKATTSYKSKFEQLKSKLIQNGYNPQNFSNDLPKFINSFENHFEYNIFMYENDINTILTRYNS